MPEDKADDEERCAGTSQVGVGALIRYSRADVKFDDPDIGKQTVKAGGVEVAGGVRIRF